MGLPPSVVLQMPARDFDLLKQYGEQEPFGPWRDNWNIANVGAALFNINRGKNEPVTADRFMYKPAHVYAAEHRAGVLGFMRTAARPAAKGGKKPRRRLTVDLGDGP